MFCEECGTKNKQGSAFCEKCGHKFEQQTVQREKKPMSKKSKIITGLVIGVIVLLTAAYFIIGSMFKPEKIALKYFKAYTSKDASAIYDTLQLEDSKFVSKKLLKEAIENDDKIELENYNVDEVEQDGQITTVTIKYVEKGSTKEREKTIRLAKSSKKQWLLFDKWVVDTGDIVAKDITVTAPKDTTVKINGIEIPEKYKNDSYSYGSTVYYKIPKIVKGKYTVTAELENGIELEGEMKISNNYDSFSSSRLELSKSSKKDITKTSKEAIETIYQAIIEKKDFSEIKDKFEEDYQDDFESTYNNLKSYIMTDYSELKEFKLNDINVKYTSIYNGELSVTFEIKYDYKVARKSGDKTEEKEKKNQTRNVYAKFSFDDKKLVLTEFTSLISYFSYY